MSWRKLIERLAPLSVGNRLAWQDLSDKLIKDNPAVYWYPGSGLDLTPLALDLPGNPVGERLFPLRGQKQKRGTILWLNDYADRHNVEQPVFDFGFSKDEIHGQLGATLDGVEPIGSFSLATRDYQTGQAANVPVAFFTACIGGGSNAHRRPERGDQYYFAFSPVESEALLRQVFVPDKIRIRVVALIRQGGFSSQRTDFKQYRDLPGLLRENKAAVGRVEAFLVDQDDMGGLEIPGYEPSNHVMPHWGAGGTRMWLQTDS